MGRVNLLFVDNAKDFLETYKEALELAGYDVTTAETPGEARAALRRGNIDLAILDVRLEDDHNPRDDSGIQIALLEARMTPKIILTEHPAIEQIRTVYKPLLDGLPSAVSYVDKREGFECLLKAIEEALGPELDWMRKVKAALSDTNTALKIDQDDIRAQARLNFYASLGFAVLGAGIILTGIVLSYQIILANQNGDSVKWISTAAAVVTEAVAFLFFRRADRANQRADRLHDERISGQRFEALLKSCDAISAKAQRDACLVQVIVGAKAAWLGGAEPLSIEPKDRPETV